ncbi:MAG: flagellar biosynthesis protein FlhB [Pseudomonadota bacterium]
MAEDQLDRTEPATQKRIDDARKKGQIPRSRDLSAAAVMLTAGIGLQTMGGALGERLAGVMKAGLSLTRAQALDENQMVIALGSAGAQALQAVIPILGLTMLAALSAPLLLGGWAFSGEALVPNFSRLNPVTGFGRMFALRSWVELGKALAKFAVVGCTAAIVLRHNMSGLLGLGSEPVGTAIGHAMSISGQSLIALTAALILIAAVDVPFQLWQHAQDLRMSRDELRGEMKEADGSPEMKGRIRSLQRERAQRRMMLDVPKADVIIVNPTHFAVALRYDDKKMRAPVVVAKGVELIAARIREVATEHSVPIFEAPPLARALYRSAEIGAEIPANLYVAVAQILTYIFQLRTARRDHTSPPPAPTIEVSE